MHTRPLSLHGSDPDRLPSYVHWYTHGDKDEAEEEEEKEEKEEEEREEKGEEAPVVRATGGLGDYWEEYYRPRLLSSFDRLYAFNMNTTPKHAQR